MKIEGRIVDIIGREIFEGAIEVKNGMIESVRRQKTDSTKYILPGFIDSHVHIESSMLNPVTFANEAVKHGVVSVVTDPHEIANVCGMDGIDYMVERNSHFPMKIYFTVPSCVPSTSFESAGAEISPSMIETLIARDEFVGLSEMMNYPGVINQDKDCIDKLNIAKLYNKPVDGHAPMLSGNDLQKYIDAGISTDHECDTIENAKEKIRGGMKILIREGSSAKNFDTLIPLISEYPDMIMFCTDDYKASDLKKGYINKMVSKAVQSGYDLFDVLRAATYNPIKHYNLKVGLLQEGNHADFIVCENLKDFIPSQTWINGMIVNNMPYHVSNEIINNFKAEPITTDSIFRQLPDGEKVKVIGVIENQIITDSLELTVGADNNFQKIVVLNRYTTNAKPAVGYIKGFNLTKGAIASTIAHDSHNIIAVGSSDELITKAINELIAIRGGVTLISENNGESILKKLPLPIAGLMTNAPIDKLIADYQSMIDTIKTMGCELESPLMTLAFMALPVIPALKITDKGLFDSLNFKYV